MLLIHPLPSMPCAAFPGSCSLGSVFVHCLPESNVAQREEGAAKEGAGAGGGWLPAWPSALRLPTGWAHHRHGPPGAPHAVEHCHGHHQRRESRGPHFPQARDSQGLRWGRRVMGSSPLSPHLLPPCPQHGRVRGPVYPAGHHGEGCLSVSGHHPAPQVQVRMWWGVAFVTFGEEVGSQQGPVLFSDMSCCSLMPWAEVSDPDSAAAGGENRCAKCSFSLLG